MAVQRHIEILCAFVENLNVKHHDILLRLFVQYFDGKVKKWFKSLLNDSITTWEEMENSFLQKWGEKRDHRYIVTELNSMKKKPDEDISTFIKRFNKLYNNLPAKIKPPQVIAGVFFLGAFESGIGFTLRERKSHSSYQIQTDALEVEENFTSIRKSRSRNDTGQKKNGKEEATSSIQGRESQE